MTISPIGNVEKHTCGTKKRYSTESVARQKLREFPSKERKELNVYLCPFCHYWHLGRKKGYVKRVMKK